MQRRLLGGLFGLVIVAGVIALRGWDPFPVEAVRDIGFDLYQRLAPRPAGQFPVRVIDIDERSLAETGQWPWSRDVLAKLTDRLTGLGAAAIAYDILFAEPDRTSPSRIAQTLSATTAGGAAIANPRALADYDREFAAALERAPSVLAFSVSAAAVDLPEQPKAGVAISGSDPTGAVLQMPAAVLPLAELTAAAHGLGAVNLAPADTVEVVRQVPLAWSNGTTLFPALPVEALRVALGAGALIVNGEMADQSAQGYMSGLRVGEFEIPTSGDGMMRLYYSRDVPDARIPAWAVLGEDYQGLAPGISDHIVFVGTSAEGLLDIKATALGEDVPGVAIHAQIIEQILSGQFLTRPTWIEAAEYYAFALVGLVIVAAILASGPLASLAIGAALVIAGLGVSWMAFRNYGLLVDVSFPFGGGFAVYAAMIFFQFTITDADKRQIRRAFGHYVAPAVLTQIEKSERLTLGGEERDLTIMFIDVRNFTSISEAMTPEALVSMLNRMFEVLGGEITATQGTIDKFIGDAIMAFWNAPRDVERHALRACEAALKARGDMVRVNDEDAFGLKAAGRQYQELRIGIGIATGQALVGNMGLKTRFDYSCVGDVVNVASRVEGACKTVGYDIVVAHATRREAGELAFLEAGSLALKGKAEREPVFLLVGDADMAGSEGFGALGAAHERLVASASEGVIDEQQLARCQALAANVEPRLGEFYRLLPTRLEDFSIDGLDEVTRAAD